MLGLASFRPSRSSRLAAALVLTAAIGCGLPPAPPVETSDPSESGQDPSTTDAATTLPLPDHGATSTTSASSTSGSSSGIGDSSGIDFLLRPDATHPFDGCDIEAQDCPRGLKCMPYDSDGSSWWDSTGCFPIDPDPVGLGEPCQWEGSPWSGHDNCGFAQVCWSFEPGDGGVCKGLCLFEDPDAPWDPSCEDPAATPFYGCQECFCTCETSCRPLDQDCPAGQECISQGDLFACAPDASGELGAYGDPCEFINVCDPGLACVDPSYVPSCESATGCCTPFCDVTEPNACPGAAEGQECTPWYEPGDAPPGLENLGLCALPA